MLQSALPSYLCSVDTLMRATVQLLLCLLWSLVEVHSQTAPYLTFMGQTLPNHAYVDLSLVGAASDGSNSVQCHTDLYTCCSRNQGPDRGDWYHPSMSRLRFADDPGEIYEVRRVRQVDLHRRSSISVSGIYRCDIETVAVHSNDSADTTTRETVYVGLYDSGGECVVKLYIRFTLYSVGFIKEWKKSCTVALLFQMLWGAICIKRRDI